MAEAPCKDCPNRFVGCHSVCNKYISYRAEKDKEAEVRLERMNNNTQMYDYKRAKYKRLRRYSCV